jgi:ribA/ribD-fused uncharacterized protein
MELFEKIDSFKGEYRFLSNFWLCRVEYDGDIYPSVEHAYQAAKLEERVKRASMQRASVSASEAKKWGQTVAIRPDWEDIKLDVMMELVRSKFNLNPGLRQQLLLTGSKLLIEGNYWMDTFWGVCDGVGDNHLGRILMEVRAKISDETKGRIFHKIKERLRDESKPDNIIELNDFGPKVSDS